MLYLCHTPAPPLAEIVDALWSLSDSPSHATERVLPSGTLELVINLSEDEFRIHDSARPGSFRRFPGAIVSGAYRRYFVIDTREHASIMGVHFKPGRALPLVAVPPGTIGDAHVDLQTLWGPSAVELRERLCEVKTAEQRFRVLEEALRARLARSTEPRRAVQVALAHLGRPGASVGDVAARVGLSRRRLLQLFTAEVGMTPKVFDRVRRFQRALALARLTVLPDWGALSRASGYFDQSHMIREFLDLSGFSPAELVRHGRKPVKENHVAQPDVS